MCPRLLQISLSIGLHATISKINKKRGLHAKSNHKLINGYDPRILILTKHIREKRNSKGFFCATCNLLFPRFKIVGGV